MLVVELPNNFYDSPEVLQAGTLAVGYFIKALSYSVTHKTDGFLDIRMLEIIGQDLHEYTGSDDLDKVLRPLIIAGLLENCENGWKVPENKRYWYDDKRELS